MDDLFNKGKCNFCALIKDTRVEMYNKTDNIRNKEGIIIERLHSSNDSRKFMVFMSNRTFILPRIFNCEKVLIETLSGKPGLLYLGDVSNKPIKIDRINLLKNKMYSLSLTNNEAIGFIHNGFGSEFILTLENLNKDIVSESLELNDLDIPEDEIKDLVPYLKIY